jgi:hypothetical protein
MRAPTWTVAVLLALVAVLASACGSGTKESAHDAYARQLSSACDDMREKIEKLGAPNDTPMAKIYPPSVRIGHAFVAQIKQLKAPAGEQTDAALMVAQFGYYFDGLALGYAVLTKRKNQQGFIQTVGGALKNLELAEGAARKLDAPACARRPFT